MYRIISVTLSRIITSLYYNCTVSKPCPSFGGYCVWIEVTRTTRANSRTSPRLIKPTSQFQYYLMYIKQSKTLLLMYLYIMYVCMYVCTYVCMYMYVHVCTCMYMYVCMHVYHCIVIIITPAK